MKGNAHIESIDGDFDNEKPRTSLVAASELPILVELFFIVQVTKSSIFFVNPRTLY